MPKKLFRKILSLILALAAAASLAGCGAYSAEGFLNDFEAAFNDDWADDSYDSWADYYSDWKDQYGSWQDYYDSWDEFYDDAREAYEEEYAGDSSSGSSSYEDNDYTDLWDDYYEEDGYIIVSAEDSYDISDLDIAEYTTGDVIIEINGGVPFFTDEELCAEFFIQLTELDDLGRAGSAMMCADEADIQTGERGSISSIHPSGWHSNSIYNRSHLLMWKLSGCNDERNLITGTESFNQDSMLEYEYMITDFLWDNEDMHVMYRVTPLFEDDELVARGVLMEAISVEDGGEGLCFCVFCYNVEDGYDIDYSDGGYYW